MQYVFLSVVGKGHVIKFHFTDHITDIRSTFLILNTYRFVDGLKDPLQISHIIDKVIEDIAKVHDRLPEERCVTGDRDHGSQTLLSRSEQQDTEQIDRCSYKNRDGIDPRPNQVGIAHCSHPGSAAVL